MASIRDLKKDVKFMIGHFIQECYTQLAYSVVLDQENAFDIISDALTLEKETLRKLNASIKPDDFSDKKHYNKIAEDFYKRIIELTERLHSLED